MSRPWSSLLLFIVLHGPISSKETHSTGWFSLLGGLLCSLAALQLISQISLLFIFSIIGAIHSLQGHACFSGNRANAFFLFEHWISVTIRKLLSYLITLSQFFLFLPEEDPDKKVHVHWSRLNGLLKMSPVDSPAVPRPPSAKAQQNGTVEGIHEYFIVFTGFSLQEQVLKDWLKTCCKLVC